MQDVIFVGKILLTVAVIILSAFLLLRYKQISAMYSKPTYELREPQFAIQDDSELFPMKIKVRREVQGTDNNTYWLAKIRRPLQWYYKRENRTIDVQYAVIAPKEEKSPNKGLYGEADLISGGAEMPVVAQTPRILGRGKKSLQVNIAFVLDDSIVKTTPFDISKCCYIGSCWAMQVKN